MVKKTLLMLVFNGEKYLDRAFNSIYNQTISIDEVLIIDDASTDKTPDIIYNWKGRIPIEHIRNKKNIGIYQSLKQGVHLSTGELIFRIDHDDEWMPTHVEEILKLYYEDKSAKIFSSRAVYISDKGEKLKVSPVVREKDIRQNLMWDNPLVQSATAFLKSDFLEIKQADNLYSSEDYDLWIRLIDKGRLKFCPKETINYYVYGNSLSRRNLNRNYRERFSCQLMAVKLFFFSHPLRSLIIISIVLIRKLLNLRFGKIGKY
tara:strand:- start:1664 stop:2446 length:783 start_codon:yes stop_codon:yes gene_type:complete